MLRLCAIMHVNSLVYAEQLGLYQTFTLPLFTIVYRFKSHVVNDLNYATCFSKIFTIYIYILKL